MSTRKRKRFILEHKRKIKLAKSLFLAGITASAVGLQAPAEVYANTDEASSILTSTVVLDNTNGEVIKDATKGSIEISVETDDNSEIKESDGLRVETDTGLENVSTVTTVDKELENKVNKSISVPLNNESNDETESTLTSEVIDTVNTQLDEEKLVDTSTELEPDMLTGSIDGLLDSSVEKRNDANNSSNKVLNSFLGRSLSDISNSTSKNSNRSSDELYSTSSNGASLYSSTNGVTREEAVAWARSRVGQYSYYAGTGNSRFWAGQCVALIRLFAEHKFPHWRHNGNAKDYITNVPLPAGWQRIKNSSTFVPLPGDIALYNPAPVNGGYGHIGIIIEADINTSLSVEQNVDAPYQGGPAKLVRGHYRNFWGVIRPNYAPPAPVAPPVNRLDVWNIAQSVGQRVTEGDYRIVSNENPSLLVSVQDGSTNSGVNIRLEQDRNTENQVFTITHHNEGFYKIIQKSSGNAVDAEGDINGNNIASHGFHGRNNQQWIIRPTGDGYTYEIIDRRSGLVMDIAGGRIGNGTNIQLWESNGTGAQKFRLVAVDSDARKTISDGTYRILSKFNEQMGLSEVASGDSSHSNAQINTSSGNQQFDVKYLGNGYYSITSKVTGRKLDVFGDKSYMGSNVVFHTANASDAQQWIIKEAGNGYYEIIAKKKNMYLDTDGSQNVAIEGGNVQIWRSSGSVNQLWKFVAIPERPAVVAGWKKDNKGWWYQNEDGSYPKNDWKFVDKKWYYFDNSGYMLTGWQTIKGEFYYLQPDGRMAASQWIKHLNNWYYVDKSGKRVKETWVGDYYLKSDSKMATSQWIQTGGIWYYVDETGRKITNKWIDGYYLKPDSKMATSQWIQTEGIWYYVDKTGKRVKDTWMGEYYLKSDSKMATSQWIQTEGIWYYVDKTGKRVKDTWVGDYYLKSDGKMAQNEWINGIFVDSLGKRTKKP
ncbi:RICIN domain-containing protein [Streptococcus suis]|uniref:RICIN domain-containing protein n=1 Tax=Streptococcus suis TaxID=1307 RepID=UPI0037CE3680